MQQAANALAAAATEGIVHRDVKPGNIMLDRRGRAVLTDFGIACSIAEQADSGGSATVMGTVGYLPPEALTGEAIDARGDMFSLGAVYYEMLTGERLISARSIKDSFARLANPSFPDLSAVEGRVDERVVDILRRLLAVKPDERYADWQALLADMAPLKSGETGPIERSDSGPSTAEREVTEALATARLETADDAPAGATATIDTVATDTHSAARSAKTRTGNAWAALALIVVAVLLLAAGGYGLARVAPDAWDRASAWIPGLNSDAPQTPPTAAPTNTPSAAGPYLSQAVADQPDPEPTTDQHSGQREASDTGGSHTVAIDPVAMAETSETVGVEEFSVDTISEPAAGYAPLTVATAADEMFDIDVDAADDAEAQQPLNAGSTPTEADQLLSAALDDDQRVARVETSTVDRSPPATPVAAPPPRGIVVIGVGDPVLADPMVREIESALRAAGQPLVDRGFVSGYQRHVEGEEVDLGGLSGPSLTAGARYAVIVRALPAGERQLSYYNRVETAFIAQLEAQTFDLYEMRQMGASPIEQIEFTSLNATDRAVASVRPWLDGIRAQFE